MKLQHWIKAEREAGRHWTQKTIAKHIGVHEITLNKMLTGRLEARAGIMQKVEELTGGAVGLSDWPTRKDAA